MITLPASPSGIIVDPQLPARVRRLVCLPHHARASRAWLRRWYTRVPHRRPVVCLLLVTLLAYVSAQPPRAAAAAGLAAVGAGSVAALAGVVAARARRRYQDRYVELDLLDDPARNLHRRAHAAISQVLSSRVLADGQLDAVVTAAVLRQHEWDVARILSSAAQLRAEQQLLAAGPSSPEVDRVAHPQTTILHQVLAVITSRVLLLEGYASLVADADTAYLAWLRARRLADLDHRLLDLLAASIGAAPPRTCGPRRARCACCRRRGGVPRIPGPLRHHAR